MTQPSADTPPVPEGGDGSAGHRADGPSPAGSGDAGVRPVELPPSRRPSRRKPSLVRNLVEWVVVIGGTLALVSAVNAFLFQPFRIPSASMYPTLKVGDRVVVNKLSYDLHDVHRGDVVVFTRPSCDPTDEEHPSPAWASCSVLNHVDDLIKRVVAVGGETISIHDDHVYIDGRLLSEPYVRSGAVTRPQIVGCAFPGTYTVPEGEVFVMGDNREDSGDSRCFGPITTGSIVGRAFVRIWPPSRLGGL